jgi:hypothetical protein
MSNVEYDLSRGSVASGLRFHDERNSQNLLLTSNRVDLLINSGVIGSR